MRKQRDSWKQHIARNFDRAVYSYESQSPVQKKSASHLADLINVSLNNDINHIFEFGCGTGHLTKILTQNYSTTDWLISDISPQMVARCMKSLPKGPNFTYTVMDAEELSQPHQFDLICSNLAAQWFNDTQNTIQNLIAHLKPGGLFAISTLGPNTFTSWRESFKAAGSTPVMPDYPDMEDWRKMLPEDGETEITSKTYEATYKSAYDFARALKDIGAHAHSPGHDQLNPGLVRSVLREFDAKHNGQSVIADYEIYFISFKKASA